MRTKRVLRYYCDHCNKGGCGKAAMIRHEQRCVKNPSRTCGFCVEMGEAQKPMTELLKALEDGSLEQLREVSNNCPACILATIVQYRSKYSVPDDPVWIDFNYKEEAEAYWVEKRDASSMSERH